MSLLLCVAGEMHAQITYKLKVSHYVPEAVGSYPQQILNEERQDTVTSFIVRVGKVDDASIKQIAQQCFWSSSDRYAPEIAAYLASTSLINKDIPEIETLADSLFGTEKKTLRMIQKGLDFVSHYLTFDDSLAMEISKGTCHTLPVETIQRRRKGTCSEYTNLFIALMRQKQIPARFVMGYIYMPARHFSSCHAWAECYIKGYGWLPVDPQNALLRFPPTAIKLFVGADFDHCGVKDFSELVPLEIEIIE